MGLPSYRRDTKALRADKDQMQRSVLMTGSNVVRSGVVR